MKWIIALVVMIPIVSWAQTAEELVKQGVEKAEAGKISEAYILFQKATKSDPKLAKAHYNLAMAAQDQGLKKAAYEAYVKYLELNPTADEKDEVIKELVKLNADLKLPMPPKAKTHFDQGEKNFRDKKYALALSDFQSSAKQAPWFLDSNFNMAVIYARQGKKSEAMKQMDTFSKYSHSAAVTDLRKSNVEKILSSKSDLEKVTNEAETKKDEAKSATHHAGVAFMIGFGSLFPSGNNAYSSGGTSIKYKDVFDKSSIWDFHMHYTNPDSTFMWRVGTSQETVKVKGGAPDIPVRPNPDLSVTEVNVAPTDINIWSVYGGLGIKLKYLYGIVDAGFGLVSSEDVDSPIVSGGQTINSVPIHETVIYFAFAGGAHIDLSSRAQLIFEGRYSVAPLNATYLPTSDSDGDPAVKGAQWFGTFKLMVGGAFRF